MSELFRNLNRAGMSGLGTPLNTREAAVGAALVLINSKAANSPDKTETLKEEMERLSVYADQIQEALKVK
ncbi:hypothetical protein [Pseudomonas sp. 10S4]|uniref:hypothetical protein n=1 Tax=Pseudomonas sp. 10S4 TaxID=3048583 RepID=UPI002AC8E27E|nr:MULTISPECIES: hypothetical protein [unclassified Pseudomonas]MEB0226269.1 hypothetical protein [Pseudomonas sp. 5S1]MEB0294910.1 hypothetical protein [Pseudomonas sp. 10S4]WPX18145.1 hypothetical protein RHM58_31100 [Pseudomonas sp. 10S4]